MTVEGLKTPANANEFKSKQDMHEDVTGLALHNLDYYVRTSFLDHPNINFLPGAFWREAYQGSSGRGDGRMAEGAAEFFGNLYTFAGRVHFIYPKSNDEDDRTWVGYPVHVEYRERLRSVLATLMDEALETFPPSDEQQKFALCSVIAVSRIAIGEIDVERFPFEESQQVLYKKAKEITRDKRFNRSLHTMEPDQLTYIKDVLERAIIPDEPHPSSWQDR